MNSISSYIYSFFEAAQSNPASEQSDMRIVGTALAGLSLVAIAYATRNRCFKKDPQIMQVFEKRWRQMNPEGRYVPMRGYINEKDAALLKGIIQNWQLHSGFCFFDFLGVDLYRDWKAAGKSPADFSHFSQLCKALSTILLCSLDPRFANISENIKQIRKEFQTLGSKIPEGLKPKFNFFLRMLEDPKKAIILGTSAMALFEEGAMLDEGGANHKDLQDMLEFCASLHPSLSFLLRIKSPSKLSNELSKLIDKIEKETQKTSAVLEWISLEDRRQLIRRLKQTVDLRFLGKNISFCRVFQNALFLGDSPLSSFSKKKYDEFVVKGFCNSMKQLLTPSPGALIDEHKRVHSVDSIETEFSIVAAKCPRRSIYALECQIVDLLREKSKTERDPHAYAEFFLEMVRLYQIAHDIQLIKDPTKDLLNDRAFPKAFAALACLPEPAEREATTPFTHISSSDSQSAVISSDSDEAYLPKREVGAASSLLRKEKHREDFNESFRSEESAAPATPIRSSPGFSAERPVFPRANAKATEVMDILLNNGFVIERVKGSHYNMLHLMSGVKTTVPYHHAPLKPGTLASIRRAFYDTITS